MSVAKRNVERELSQDEGGLLKADGFDAAIIGIGRRCGQPDLVVYDYEKAVRVLMKRDKMSRQDAVEYMEFNVVGAWVGENTPLWLNRMTAKEVEREAEERQLTFDFDEADSKD